MKKTASDRVFDLVVYVLLALVSIVMIYPFLNVLAIAMSDYSGYLENPMMIFPKNFTLDAVKEVFRNPLVLSGYGNTIFITLVGTLLDLVLLTLVAYPLSRSGFRGKKIFMSLIIFTMLFNGGLIPNFYLIRSLHLLDTRWALIFPRLLSAFNIILLINFFQSLPVSLLEAAKLDVAGEWKVLYQIVLPLSKPIMATLALFVAVGYWNSFFEAIMYIRATDRWTLQLVLREIVMSSNTQMLQTGGNLAELGKTTSESLKYATLIVAIVPIMCVYPFLQKYFTQGVMVGAVKG